MMLVTLLLSLCAWSPHGGQYLPPVADPDTPPALEGVVSQPGLGPEIVFTPSRWEWWYDFNQEALLRLRERMPGRALATGKQGFEPLTPADRGSVVLPALVDALRHRAASSNPPVHRDYTPRDVRAAAVLSLGRLNRPEAVPFIEVVLDSDPDLFVRTQAILALGFTGSPSAVETLGRIFADDKESAELRSYAVVGLALIGNAQAVDILLKSLSEKALKNLNNQLRAAVIYAAGLTGDPSLGAALRALSGTWLYGKEADVRALVAVALGRIDDPATVPFLLGLLSDADNQVRRSTAAALGAISARLDDDSLKLMIGRVGTDADQSTRFNLILALGWAGRAPSREFLRGYLPSCTYDYRPYVALALAFDGDAGNADVLLSVLANEHESSSKSAIAYSLGLLRAPQAAEPLVKLLESEHDPLTLGYLCLAVGLLAPPQSDVATRIERIVHEAQDVELIRSGIIALGLLGDRDGLMTLTGEVAKYRGTVSRAAILHGLGLVGDRRMVLPLIEVVRDEGQPSYVRTYALQALGELSDPRLLSPAWRLSSHVELNQDVGFLFEMYRVL